MEARVLEERVRRVGQRAAYPRHCADSVGAWPKVCDAAEELQRVPFLRSHDGIFGQIETTWLRAKLDALKQSGPYCAKEPSVPECTVLKAPQPG